MYKLRTLAWRCLRVTRRWGGVAPFRRVARCTNNAKHLKTVVGEAVCFLGHVRRSHLLGTAARVTGMVDSAHGCDGMETSKKIVKTVNTKTVYKSRTRCK